MAGAGFAPFIQIDSNSETCRHGTAHTVTICRRLPCHAEQGQTRKAEQGDAVTCGEFNSTRATPTSVRVLALLLPASCLLGLPAHGPGSERVDAMWSKLSSKFKADTTADPSQSTPKPPSATAASDVLGSVYDAHPNLYECHFSRALCLTLSQFCVPSRQAALGS
jgi:hypothetical protein